ncbi:MAG TPA: restriction endonuclease subunit S [Anaerohalosphaeraceae bacterium]|nr:restriction endonuclease subunit S [Anaerohalosphaeraceae bacterium]
MRLGDIVEQASETWDQGPTLFGEEFPYIEISAVGLGNGNYSTENVSLKNAPSRARMIVRENDIIVSTTRPHRGAIACIKKEHDGYIASTGFAVLRRLKIKDVDKEYLINVLRSSIVLQQFLQRSSGGNYPAITPDEVDNVLIPLPDLSVQKRLIKIIERSQGLRRHKLEQANVFLGEIENLILSKLGINNQTNQNRHYFAVKLQQLHNNPLNVERYRNNSNNNYSNWEPISKKVWISKSKISPSKISSDTEWDWIRIDDISPNPLGIDTIRTEIGKDIQGTFFEVEEGDVLLARLGPTILNRKIVICPQLKRRTVASSEFLVLRCHSDWYPETIVWALRTTFYRDLMYSKCRGGTPSRYRLDADDFQNIPFPEIEPTVQSEIVTCVRHNIALANRLRTEAEMLWLKAINIFEMKVITCYE